MTATNLPDLLAEHGIFLKRQPAPGNNIKTICPRCNGGRTKEQSLSVHADADGAGVAWVCKRGQCGWKGGGRLANAAGTSYQRREARPVKKPPVHTAQPRPAALYKWAEARGISADTVDHFGVYAIAAKWFPPPIDKERPAVVFPYLFNGEVVNRKYRPPEKNPQMAEKDALPTLYNIDSIHEPDVVWWVEGEPDVLAMHEAGYKQTVSLKDGATKDLRDEDDPRREDDKRFLALATHADLLEKVEKFVLAGDMDVPGDVLREELARRLGRHRCWVVTWPDGCKDCGDVLQKHGREAVQAAVEAARPYPIEGVQRVEPGTLLALRRAPPPAVMSTGCATTDTVLRLPAEGRLIIVTGLPNSGKSAWVSWIIIHTALNHARRWLVFSPEMQPWEQYASMLASTFIGKPFYSSRDEPGMSDLEIEHAEQWLRDRVMLLASDAEQQLPTLDWILDRAKACVLRDGVTDLVIDPWNEVDHERGGLTETEYVGRNLQRIKAFCLRYGCNGWVIAHPKQMQPAKPGGKIGTPGMYDISGGANWANKADLGIVIHTPDAVTELHVVKARFRRFGRKGNKADLDFNPATGRYSSPYVQGNLGGID